MKIFLFIFLLSLGLYRTAFVCVGGGTGKGGLISLSVTIVIVIPSKPEEGCTIFFFFTGRGLDFASAIYLFLLFRILSVVELHVVLSQSYLGHVASLDVQAGGEIILLNLAPLV